MGAAALRHADMLLNATKSNSHCSLLASRRHSQIHLVALTLCNAIISIECTALQDGQVKPSWPLQTDTIVSSTFNTRSAREAVVPVSEVTPSFYQPERRNDATNQVLDMTVFRMESTAAFKASTIEQAVDSTVRSLLLDCAGVALPFPLLPPATPAAPSCPG
jgi:hypothetical protein